jgi:hypothetical protein
VFDYRRKLL